MLTYLDAKEKFNLEQRSEGEPPFVSIYVPSDKGALNVDEKKIAFKNLASKAQKLLEQKYSKREYGQIIKDLHEFHDTSSDKFWRSAEGIAVLSSNDGTIIIPLGYNVPERVAVADSFHIKPLIYNYQYGSHYFAVAISQDRFELLEGDFFDFKVVDLPSSIPNTINEILDYTGVSTRNIDVSGGHGYTTLDELNEKDLEKFFRHINDEVYKLISDSGCPVVLIGLKENLAKFREMTTIPRVLDEAIEKPLSSMKKEDLHDRITEIIKAEQKKNIHDVLKRYGDAHAQEKASADLRTIAQALVERRVEALFIDEQECLPGTFDKATGALELRDKQGPDVDDITDDFAQAAYHQGAEVYSLNSSEMPTKSGVAALFRY